MKKKYILIVLTILLILTASCTSANRNKSLINYDSGQTKGISDNYRNSLDSKFLSKNQNIDNYFKSNNITNYKYGLLGDTLKIWIDNFENMTPKQRQNIRNDLKMFNDKIEFVNNKEDIK